MPCLGVGRGAGADPVLHIPSLCRGMQTCRGSPQVPRVTHLPLAQTLSQFFSIPPQGFALGPPSNLRFPLKFYPALTLIYPRMGAQLGPPSFSLGVPAIPRA